jgi:hypothetical protein
MFQTANWRDGGFLYADRIDGELHRARSYIRKAKVTSTAVFNCFVRFYGADYLVWADALFEGSPGRHIESANGRTIFLLPS